MSRANTKPAINISVRVKPASLLNLFRWLPILLANAFLVGVPFDARWRRLFRWRFVWIWLGLNRRRRRFRGLAGTDDAGHVGASSDGRERELATRRRRDAHRDPIGDG